MPTASTQRKPERLSKHAALDYWRRRPDNVDICRHIRPVPYTHKGSTFTQDGIRVTGTREFIDDMLSVLKPLLSKENGQTRLALNMAEAVDRETGKPTGTWTLYVQVHERGGQRDPFA
jgi:hypothetical protein